MFFISILLKYILPIALFYLLGIYFIRMTLKNLLWHCAGANVELLEKCPNDHSRYQNIGATIIMTAFLAWISMGFALHSVFNSMLASVLVGFVWACMIFILDRTIVTSMQKPIRNNIQSQGVTIWGVQGGGWAKFGDGFREIGFTLLRLVIAILISFVITKPLEIKIFESRLRPVLDEMKDEQASKDSLGIWNSGEIVAIKQDKLQIEQNIESLNSAIANNEKCPEYDQLTKEAQDCLVKIQGEISSKRKSIEIYKAKIGQLRTAWAVPRPSYIEEKIGEYQNSYKSLEGQITTLQKPCNEITQKRDKVQRNYIDSLKKGVSEKSKTLIQRGQEMEEANKKAFDESSKRESHRADAFKDNIIPQIQALEKLKSKDDAMFYTSWLIMFMFIIIETAPVLAKLFSKRGQYDDAFEEAEIAKWIDLQKIKAEQIQDMNVSLSAKEVISKTNIQELEAKAQRDALANENSHNQDTTHKLALQAAKHTKAYNEELSNYEKLVSKIAEAQRKIALEQVEIWKNEQLEILKKKSNNNNPPTI